METSFLHLILHLVLHLSPLALQRHLQVVTVTILQHPYHFLQAGALLLKVATLLPYAGDMFGRPWMKRSQQVDLLKTCVLLNRALWLYSSLSPGCSQDWSGGGGPKSANLSALGFSHRTNRGCWGMSPFHPPPPEILKNLYFFHAL